jgi:prepilin peptidase CpaA
MTPTLGIAACLGAAALIEDLLCRRVPGWLVAAGTAAGLACAGWNSWHGFEMAVCGAVVGFLVLLPIYWWGGVARGAVGLMAAYGALLGPSGIVLATLFAAVIGSLCVAGTLLLGPRRPSSPYASAIVLGAWVSLLGRGI